MTLLPLTLIVLSSFFQAAFASDECKSVWIYHPYKTCATPANGLDLTQPGELVDINLKSDWLPGGRDQEKVCRDVAADVSATNVRKGLHAEVHTPTPVGEQSEPRNLRQEYKYVCEIDVRKYPFKTAANKACGVEEKPSYQVGGSSRALAGEDVSCLSCENFSDQPPAKMVECLRDSIENVIEPRAIDLRDSDIAAVSAQVKRVLDLSRQVRIKGLNSTDEIGFFADFLSKHSPQIEPQAGQGGWGGQGTRPTQE